MNVWPSYHSNPYVSFPNHQTTYDSSSSSLLSRITLSYRVSWFPSSTLFTQLVIKLFVNGERFTNIHSPIILFNGIVEFLGEHIRILLSTFNYFLCFFFVSSFSRRNLTRSFFHYLFHHFASPKGLLWELHYCNCFLSKLYNYITLKNYNYLVKLRNN